MALAVAPEPVTHLGMPLPANAPGVRQTRWTLGAAVTVVAATGDGRHAVFGLADGCARLVPLHQFGGRKMSSAVLHQGAVRTMCADAVATRVISMGADGRVVTVDSDGYAAELDDEAGADQAAQALAATDKSAAPAWRAIARGRAIRLFDEDGVVRREFQSPGGLVRRIGFGPGGRFLLVAATRALELWRLDAGDGPTCLARLDGSFVDLAWSPDGERFAALSDEGRVAFWEIVGESVRALSAPLGEAGCLAWSSGGDFLVGGGRGTVLAWPTGRMPQRSGIPVRLGARLGRAALQVGCHPTQPLAAVGYDDGCIMLVDLVRRRDIVLRHATGGGLSALTWTSGGDFLAVGDSDGEAILFDFTTLTPAAPRVNAAARRTDRPERSGNYPVETRTEEIARLRMQADAMAFDAGILLDRIGVGLGWHCLELACGTGGITDQLAARVLPTGRVVGLDADTELLSVARQAAEAEGRGAIEWVHGDAYRTPLEDASFDLVHMRFILSTAGQVDDLLAEALRLTRPGGIIAAQEPDVDALECYPPHPAWDRLKEALAVVFDQVANARLAKSLFTRFRAAGLTQVRYRPFLVGFTHTDPMADYLPQTILSLRPALIEHGIMSATEIDDMVAALRPHMADPDTVSTSYLVAQVWGQKP